MFSVGPLDILAAGLLALRRYGLGPSEHLAGSHRRYSAADVSRLLTCRPHEPLPVRRPRHRAAAQYLAL